MKLLIPAMTILALSAAGQHVPVLNPSRGMTPPAGAFQYGNILFPGGLPVQQSHASRLGRSVSGFPSAVPGPVAPVGRPRTVVVPYAIPVYYGDYGYQQPQAAPNVTVIVPQQPAPSVVINNTYAPDSGRADLQSYSSHDTTKSGVQVFEGPKPASAPSAAVPASDRPTLYLIALKDTTVRQAIGYWVEDATLNYLTPQGSINHVTLDQVDRDTTRQLNSERKLTLDLNGR